VARLSTCAARLPWQGELCSWELAMQGKLYIAIYVSGDDAVELHAEQN
jgi:hypothetical protein